MWWLKMVNINVHPFSLSIHCRLKGTNTIFDTPLLGVAVQCRLNSPLWESIWSTSNSVDPKMGQFSSAKNNKLSLPLVVIISWSMDQHGSAWISMDQHGSGRDHPRISTVPYTSSISHDVQNHSLMFHTHTEWGQADRLILLNNSSYFLLVRWLGGSYLITSPYQPPISPPEKSAVLRCYRSPHPVRRRELWRPTRRALPQTPGCHDMTDMTPVQNFNGIFLGNKKVETWQCVKTNSTPGEHQNSW